MVKQKKELNKEDKKPEEVKEKPKQKPLDVISVSPNYFITSMNPSKFTKGAYFGNQIIFGKTFNQDLDGKIRIYEDRVRGWFFDFAKILLKEKHADFVVLMICTSYIEGNQQFREGKSSKTGKSGKIIKRALKTIFEIPKEKEWAIEKFVTEVRHGLFHDGMTRKDIVLSRVSPSPFSIKIGTKNTISINPILFFWAMEEDFKEYINDLKNPNNKVLRGKFERHWNERYTPNF